ncbi:DUF2461 family protein [Hymenobacter sp. BRD67]|nr:DUF2461 family protein [Hymenobacter sp. BRD67]
MAAGRALHAYPAELTAIRQEIHYNGASFHQQLTHPLVLQHFPGGLDMGVPQLTRPPRGYLATDPDLPWLKLKSFGVVQLFRDGEVLAPDFIDRVVAGMQAARPWVSWLNEALYD